MATTIQVRVDDELKKNADALFRELGTDTTTAIRMFLTQAIQCNGFPFEIKRIPAPYRPLSEEEFFRQLDESRYQADHGQVEDVDCVVAELRGKYGL